jgi:hypothetical protein
VDDEAEVLGVMRITNWKKMKKGCGEREREVSEYVTQV